MSATVMLSLVGLASAGGDLCHGLQETSDAFDGGVVSMIDRYAYDLVIEGDEVLFRTRLVEPGVQAKVLAAGHAMHIRLEDGKTVTLYSTRDESPAPQAHASEYAVSVSTVWEATYALDAAAIHAIAQSRPTVLRFTLENEYTSEFSTGDSRLWQRDFACIANTLAGAT